MITSGTGFIPTVDVAETAGFALLRVMKTASPVDRNITFISA